VVSFDCKTAVIRCAVRWEIGSAVVKTVIRDDHEAMLSIYHNILFPKLLDGLRILDNSSSNRLYWKICFSTVHVFCYMGKTSVYADMGLIPGSCNVAVKLLHLI
jgi:hypothetical protein